MDKVAGKSNELSSHLDDGDLKEMLESIRILANDGNREVTSALKAIFKGSTSLQKYSSARRYETFIFTLNLMQTSELSPSIITELVSILMSGVDSFQTSLLVNIAEHFVTQIKEYNGTNVNWLELFPVVLNTLSTRDTVIAHHGKDMSGTQLKAEMLFAVCDNELKPSSVMMLLPKLQTVEMESDEIKLFIEIMLSTLEQLKYQELPSYIYQLLHFPAKMHRKLLLRGIILYFVNQDNRLGDTDTDSQNIIDTGNSELFRQIEGSVIVMIQLSCCQDRDLGQSFISMLNSLKLMPAAALSSFMFSVALALSCIHRYEESVLTLLRSMVMNSLRNKEQYSQSLWMRDFVPVEVNIDELLKKVITNTKSGWDCVSQGLVKFGFSLLDAYGPKIVGKKEKNVIKPHTLSISEQACTLGSMILRRTFWAHDAARPEVFEQILKRVVTKSNSPVSHYIDVLSGTVQGDPQLLLEILTKLIEILDYLPFLTYYNAIGILKALTPLLKVSMPLKDALMLVLRKSLFHRDIEPRKIAIAGYLMILKRINAKGKMSLSQSQCSFNSQPLSISFGAGNSDSVTEGGPGRSMCLEIIGILKRTFVQQAEVKQLLYEGLFDVVVKKPDLADITLELLLTQLEKFVDDSDGAVLPLDIMSCFISQKEDFVVNEPLAHLITSISLILDEAKNRPVNDDDDDEFDVDQNPQIIIDNLFNSITTKMSEAEIGDLNLSKVYEADEALTVEKKEKSFLLLAIYEALMEHTLMKNKDFSVDGCEKMLSLYQKHKRIVSILQNKKGKMSKNKSAVVQMRSPHVTMRFAATITEALFLNTNPAHQDGLNLLRANNFFVKFVLNCCKEKLLLYNDAGKSDGFSEHMKNSYEFLCQIGQAFLKTYARGNLDSFQSLEMIEVIPFFVESLNSIFTYIFSTKNHQKFIAELLSQSTSSVVQDPYVRVTKRFQKLTIKALSDTENDVHLKEVVPLLTIIEYLCTTPSVVKEDVYKWTEQLCKEQSLEDISVAKKLLSLSLILCHHSKERMTYLLDIAKNIRHHLGDAQPDEENPNNNNNNIDTYNVVNEQTSSHLMSILIDHIGQILTEIEWSLKTLKSTILVPGKSRKRTSPKGTEKEGKICDMFLDLIKIFHEVVQTAVPVGNISNDLLKTTTVLYKCITDLCKHYQSVLLEKKGNFHPQFEKMVKSSGTQLTPNVYLFITYIQNVEAENNETKSKSAKVVKYIKTIPPLVFAIEQYEGHLITLSKKSKRNLMSHMKLSTSRDFRINPAVVTAIEEMDEPTNDSSTNPPSPQNDDSNTSVSSNHSNNESRKRPAAKQTAGKASKFSRRK